MSGIVKHCMMKPQHSLNKRFFVVLSAGLFALAGCSSGGDDSTEASQAYNADAKEEMSYELAAADSSAAMDVYESDAGGSFENVVDTSVEQRDLIIEMGLSIESDDIAASVSAIRSLATTAGGVITSSNIGLRTEDQEDGWATIVVRVPPERLDGFLVNLDDPERVGTLTSSNTWTQDVTEQLVELDVRIENQRESVARIRELLAEAKDLTDVVTLEYELNRRQTELEVQLARQASLEGRVALSTVTIDLYSPGKAPTPESERTLISGFTDGWNSFVGTASSLGWFVAAASPYVGASILLLLVVGFIRRSRRVTEG